MEFSRLEPQWWLLAAWGLVLAATASLLVLRRMRQRAPHPESAAGRTTDGRPRLFEIGKGFADRLRSALRAGGDADERLAAVEEVLLKADVGVRTTQPLLDRLRPRLESHATEDSVLALVADEMLSILGPAEVAPVRSKPHVILVSGVNGVGKTTSVAKLANFYHQQGLRVLAVAADTFRAAAAAQLANWAARVGVECIRRDDEGADPSAVVYDGIQAALSRSIDVVIVDTAGRLHVKANLVAELQKIGRTIGRLVDGAPHESLLVIDATTGQNASNQARVFAEALPLSGIVLTKLDGTAKGGSVFAIRSELGLPIRYIGYGEGMNDFAAFEPRAYVDGLLGRSSPRPSD